LCQRLEQIVARHGHVHFVVRLDPAGQYADNLLHFLHTLNHPAAHAARLAEFTISCGDPQKNKNYRVALFGGTKSDPVEARAAGRYALSEPITPLAPMSDALRTLRQAASRLLAATRQRTRAINQLHGLLT
jgi:hypothetical protein